MSYEYSDKERKLFNWFGIVDPMINSSSIGAAALYRIAIENAFLGEFNEGCMTESLRRCGRAMLYPNKLQPKRLTPEWDEMIRFE